MEQGALVSAPPPPPARLCVGVTGHREDNRAFSDNRDGIVRAIREVVQHIDVAVIACRRTGMQPATTRLHSLLADGTDALTADCALSMGWELVAPLPFGLALNVAINAHPETAEDAHALLRGAIGLENVQSEEVRQRAERLFELAARARLFELADRDALVSRLYLEKLAYTEDARSEATFSAESSLRVALAGRVMVEQSDLLVAVWDGTTRSLLGGTGHTIHAALEAGAPVIWIDARDPSQWRILRGPESLVAPGGDALPEQGRDAVVSELVADALGVQPAGKRRRRRVRHTGHEMLAHERWPKRSRWAFHAYRRIEAMFGNRGLPARFRSLVQTYETPDGILEGSAAPLLRNVGALPGQEPGFVERIANSVLRRFAWADGVSAYLSDIYRGGMTSSFLLASLAIIGGIAYLPFSDSHHKWLFASFELMLLVGILAFTLVGQRQHWHARWFETRRVAEYLRHGPILLMLGVSRAPGRWPRATDTSWPERCALNALREVGLPRLEVTQSYLRQATRDLLLDHVRTQREYHTGKARRLHAVHHNLDHTAQVLFALAIVSVATYLLLKVGGIWGWWTPELAEGSSKLFTFLGVLLPTSGGALAGVRYFGDFERFAAISSVTAEKLQGIENRIGLLLQAPEDCMDYGTVTDLAHATDEVVVTEIESWQAVFAGKHVTVPV